MATNHRTLSNGDIVFPRRGKPPACPFGYEPVEGEPFKFTPVLEACDYRIKKDFVQPCGRKVGMSYCEKNRRYIKKIDCQQCPKES